jgi:hypothetical protein
MGGALTDAAHAHASGGGHATATVQPHSDAKAAAAPQHSRRCDAHRRATAPPASGGPAWEGRAVGVAVGRWLPPKRGRADANTAAASMSTSTSPKGAD